MIYFDPVALSMTYFIGPNFVFDISPIGYSFEYCKIINYFS